MQDGISRIVVDLKAPVLINDAFLLRANDGRPNRLVVDFKKVSAAEFEKSKGKTFGILKVDDDHAAQSAVTSKPVTTTAAATGTTPRAVPLPPPSPRRENAAPAQVRQQAPPAPQPAPEIQQVSAAGIALPGRKPVAAAPPVTRKGKRLIVIDPGHGGVDPGAIGANGVFEKHVTLSMGKELKDLLERTGRYEVKLTRGKDKYLRLYQRVQIARAADADLFISLHADSIGKSNVRGASIYTLSEKASDEQTAKLADRENKADIIAGTDLSHEDEQVANILIDLAMRDTMNQSKFFANTLVDNLGDDGIKILEKPHRYAGFAVLKAPDIPSVLIEMGFMSNKSEAQMLSSPDYRQKIARALVAGIDAYFEKVDRNNRI
ncbi:MAG: N-acetylmuramoyl-L-alanine amidase [Rhodospirillales bacterium]|nr:N-acetylmuramoyl-L-alanine amidase [Rhodospirillales bacterium]MCB9996297.1 N-acetylmuramoyl-L-alanine amidase [Rhodospirillales bacterium]